MSREQPHPLLRAEDIEELPEIINVHQFNDKAVRHSRSLGDLVGMSSIGVHFVRVEPGDQSTQFHSHSNDEEFLYILSGKGLAEIGETTHEISAGDFMGFTSGSLPHNLINNSDDDLVYLMSGSRNAVDVCDYPRLKRRMYRINGHKEYADWDSIKDV